MNGLAGFRKTLGKCFGAIGLLWLSLVLFASLVVGCLWWAVWREKEIRTGRFPDGETVTIKAVTFGKEHIPGSLWQKLLARTLPTNLTAQLGIKVRRFSDPGDVLVLWLEPNPSTIAGRMVALDEQGHEGKPAGLHLGGNESFYIISWFPRRSPMLRLRTYQEVKGRRTGFIDFSIKNPAYKKYPVWTPEPLPITKRVGDEQFTLTAFRTGLYATGRLADEVATWTEFEFRNGPSNAPTGPWKPVVFSIRDATGNANAGRDPHGVMVTSAEAQKAHQARNPLGDWRAATESGMFWLDEPAWKIDITWTRILRFPFPPEQLWTIKGVTNPAPHTFIEVNATTNAPTGTLLFRGMSAERTAFPGQRAAPDAAVYVKFDASDTNALANLIRVTDDRGSNVLFTPPPDGFSPRAYTLPRLTTNSKTLDFTFAIHRKYQVEYFARPTLLHTNIQKSN